MRILSFFPEGQIAKRPMLVFTKLLTMNIKAGVRKVQKNDLKCDAYSHDKAPLYTNSGRKRYVRNLLNSNTSANEIKLFTVVILTSFIN
jgi:hypothetical protein